MKAAYFDVFAGIAGDMTLAALVDAGLPLDNLSRELHKLPVRGFELSTSRVSRGPIVATHLEVKVDAAHEAPAGRTLAEILAIIGDSTLDDPVKRSAGDVFTRLAQAEARVHGLDLQEVRLYHVGEIDTIVDVVGVVAGLRLMGIESLFSSPLPMGGPGLGGHHHAHGPAGGSRRLPIPGPATLELVAMAGAPVQGGAHDEPAWERVTPTGAALITTLASFRRPAMTLGRIGYGAGTSDFPDSPNVLRVWIGEIEPASSDLVLLETNVDDQSPQVLGYAMERLLEEGARDVWFTPIQMKKSRPATMISVLSAASLADRLTQLLLRETSTLGVRAMPVQRHQAEREVVDFTSSLGPARAKLKRLGGSVVAATPEYEDCRRIARERSLPLQDVLRTLSAEATQRFVK